MGVKRSVLQSAVQLTIVVCDAVTAATQLQEHAGSDKTWVWHARDYSDGELKEELFCMRFGSVESKNRNIYPLKIVVNVCGSDTVGRWSLCAVPYPPKRRV